MEAHVGVLPTKEEAFWASIVAKWSDACSNIVSLKTELEKAQSEVRHLIDVYIHFVGLFKIDSLVNIKNALTRCELEKKS